MVSQSFCVLIYFRPIDRIASKIVEKLRKKVSKSVVYAALDERYKTSYRVQNARKRKKKKENKTGSLAPTSELKPLIVDRTGGKTDTNSSPPVTRDVTECEHSQLKDSGN